MHRDVKPQNVILTPSERRAKLIDLGAAADLRIGINYVPNEFLLDPRYAPPEQYIMSTQVRAHDCAAGMGFCSERQGGVPCVW